jgi:Ras-related C3 botulinum toxin substrate 1
VVDRVSYQNVASKWVPEIRKTCPDVPIVLVGTKVDLREDENTLNKLKEANETPLTKEEGHKLKLQIRAVDYIECSAKWCKKISDLFECVVDAGLPKKAPPKKTLANLFSINSAQSASDMDDIQILSSLEN